MGKAAPKETSRSRQPRSKGAKGGGGDDAALIAVAAALRNIKKVFRVW